MRNLHKKISAIALASIVVLGGVGVSGVQSFAYSKQSISERSLIGNYRGFIGNDAKFKELYNKLLNDERIVSEEEYQDYKNMENKIKEIVKGLKGRGGFRLNYVGLPGKIEQEIEKKGYKFERLISSGPALGIIKLLYNFSQFRDKNYIVQFRDGGKDYKFIFYGQSI